MHSPGFKGFVFKLDWKKGKWFKKFANGARNTEGEEFQQGNPLNSHQKK